MVDYPLASELISYAQYNKQFRRQRMIPWIKNVKRKMKRHVFNEKLFYPAIEKYVVMEANKAYFKEHGSGNVPRLDKETKKYVADKLGRAIIRRAVHALEKGSR